MLSACGLVTIQHKARSTCSMFSTDMRCNTATPEQVYTQPVQMYCLQQRCSHDTHLVLCEVSPVLGLACTFCTPTVCWMRSPDGVDGDKVALA